MFIEGEFCFSCLSFEDPIEDLALRAAVLVALLYGLPWQRQNVSYSLVSPRLGIGPDTQQAVDNFVGGGRTNN